MSFHIGQKVVCVDASNAGNYPELRQGDIYTISGAGVWITSEILYDLAEVKTSVPHAWRARRFRPVIERKTDIAIFTALLNPANHKYLERAE